MSLGTHNYFARCPQRPRALLALRPSQLAAADTTDPITWACRAPRVPGTKALAATGHWRLQAGPHCDAGPSLRSACPSRGGITLRHLGLTGSPHQPQRGQQQHL